MTNIYIPESGVDMDTLHHYGVLGMRWGVRRGHSVQISNSRHNRLVNKQRKLAIKSARHLQKAGNFYGQARALDASGTTDELYGEFTSRGFRYIKNHEEI